MGLGGSDGRCSRWSGHADVPGLWVRRARKAVKDDARDREREKDEHDHAAADSAASGIETVGLLRSRSLGHRWCAHLLLSLDNHLTTCKSRRRRCGGGGGGGGEWRCRPRSVAVVVVAVVLAVAMVRL